jgi:hypothetical protein
MIYVKDITGALVEFECQTGDVKEEIEKDGVKLEYILYVTLVYIASSSLRLILMLSTDSTR